MAYSIGLVKNIITHLETEKHKRAMESASVNSSLIDAILRLKYEDNELDGPSQGQELKLNDSAEILQFQIAKFIVLNRLPFKAVEQLIPFIQWVMNSCHPKAITNSCMSRKTLTRLVDYCICGSIKEEIIKELVASPYSLALDETTDALGASYLAVCVKFLPLIDPETLGLPKNPVTKLVSIIKLKDSKTAQAIYAKLKEEIFDYHPRLLSNLMGLVTDQGANFVGKNKGLGALLKQDVPHLVRFQDLSHLYNIICQKSLKSYSQSVINCIRDICAHFNHSTIRMEKLKSIQKLLNFEPQLSILSFSPTRWLSLLDCLARILRLWEPLKIFYDDEQDEEAKVYFSAKNELYLRVLEVILDKLCYYNRLFQMDLMFYNRVKEMLIESFKIFARMVLSPLRFPQINFGQIINFDYEADIETLGDYLISDEDLRKYWIETYPNLQESFCMLSEEERKEFLSDNKNFLLKILAEMKRKLPFEAEIFRDCEPIFNPVPFDKIAWRRLGSIFTNIITPEKTERFKFELERFETNEQIVVQRLRDFNGSPLEMWQRLLNDYPSMKDLAIALLMLPHSSCPVERTFSHLKDYKTNKRNRLKVESLPACLLI